VPKKNLEGGARADDAGQLRPFLRILRGDDDAHETAVLKDVVVCGAIVHPGVPSQHVLVEAGMHSFARPSRREVGSAPKQV
jgi:hypothetical protein